MTATPTPTGRSANNAFPQWLQVDLGSAVSVNQTVLKLPPAAAWQTRTQTLTVQGSTNGSSFAHAQGERRLRVQPVHRQHRHDRLHRGRRPVRPADLHRQHRLARRSAVRAGGVRARGGDTQAPSAPSGLAFTQPASGQIRLTWNASTDNVGVTGYDIYANGQLRTSVGNVTTYTDMQPDSATVAYYVRAKDAAGNVSGNSNTVTRTGQGGDTQAPTAPGNLSYTQPAAGQIRLAWAASSDNVGVTGYNVYANGALRGSVAGTVLTYTDTQPATATVSYHVKARDAAGNESAASNTVTRTGTAAAGRHQPGGGQADRGVVGDPHVRRHQRQRQRRGDLLGGQRVPGEPDRQAGRQRHHVVGRGQAEPGHRRGATRTQTFSVLGREQSSSSFTTMVGSATYTFNPATGNTVTIPVSATAADVRLSFTANTGAPSGQVAEFQVIGTAGTEPGPDRHRPCRSRRPRRSRPTRSRCRPPCATPAPPAARPPTSTSTWVRPRSAPRTSARSRPARPATVTANIGARTAGSYPVRAMVDEANTVIEQNDANNEYTNPSNLVVAPVSS